MTNVEAQVEDNQVDEIEDDIIQEAFDEVMSEYELYSEMSIEDLLYEMFANGWEMAIEVYSDAEDEE
jgi:hypothetical protein